jgi:four helix bundle protein
MNRFRTYELAVRFYRMVSMVKLPCHLKGQLQRAASSVALNSAEGSAKPSPKERARFYRIALGSFRETVAVLDLVNIHSTELNELTDKLARHLYNLCKALE